MIFEFEIKSILEKLKYENNREVIDFVNIHLVPFMTQISDMQSPEDSAKFLQNLIDLLDAKNFGLPLKCPIDEKDTWMTCQNAPGCEQCVRWPDLIRMKNDEGEYNYRNAMDFYIVDSLRKGIVGLEEPAGMAAFAIFNEGHPITLPYYPHKVYLYITRYQTDKDFYLRLNGFQQVPFGLNGPESILEIKRFKDGNYRFELIDNNILNEIESIDDYTFFANMPKEFKEKLYM